MDLGYFAPGVSLSRPHHPLKPASGQDLYNQHPLCTVPTKYSVTGAVIKLFHNRFEAVSSKRGGTDTDTNETGSPAEIGLNRITAR